MSQNKVIIIIQLFTRFLFLSQQKTSTSASLSSISTSSLQLQNSLIEDEVAQEKITDDLTFGSIEAINRTNVSTVNVNELQDELEELRKQVKLLHSENMTLTKQWNTSEDNNAFLTSQNEQMESRLKALKASLDSALKFQIELEEFKSLAKSTQEERDNLHEVAQKHNSRLLELTTENMELNHQLDDTRDQLALVTKDLVSTRRSHNVTLEKLKQENEETKTRLDEVENLNDKLEGQIEELKTDISERESQFLSSREPRKLDMVSFDEMFEMRDDMADQIIDGPTANSTPFHKRIRRSKFRPSSISDEFKGIVLMKDSSPFCEKSILHNGSASSVVALSSPAEIEKADSSTQTGIFPIQYLQDYLDINKLLCGALSSVFMALFTFTFFGAVEFGDGRKLLPILWSSYFPEPFTMMSIQLDQDSVW